VRLQIDDPQRLRSLVCREIDGAQRVEHMMSIGRHARVVDPIQARHHRGREWLGRCRRREGDCRQRQGKDGHCEAANVVRGWPIPNAGALATEYLGGLSGKCDLWSRRRPATGTSGEPDMRAIH